DAGMLAFLVGNNHSEFAVLFHDVDALDINLRKLFLFALYGKGGKEKHRANQRGDHRVNFQETHLFFKFCFHSNNLHSKKMSRKLKHRTRSYGNMPRRGERNPAETPTLYPLPDLLQENVLPFLAQAQVGGLSFFVFPEDELRVRRRVELRLGFGENLYFPLS